MLVNQKTIKKSGHPQSSEGEEKTKRVIKKSSRMCHYRYIKNSGRINIFFFRRMGVEPDK